MHTTTRTNSRPLRGWLFTLMLFAAPQAFADTLVLSAINDFPDHLAGDAPFYTEPVRDALAINAANPAFRDVFAKANTTFSGTDGEYDVTLVGLAELDGQAVYRFSVNGELLGSSQNPETSYDYMPIAHLFEGISLSAGDVLSVESVANSNDLIPEGDGYAFARGRWTQLRLTPVGEIDLQPENVSLVTNVSSISKTIEVGDRIIIDYAVINDDNAGATATNLRVQFNIPENFEITEPNTCTTVASSHSSEHIIRCPMSQVPPGSAVDDTLLLTAIEEGNELSVHATSFANETEISGVDNRDTVFFDIEAMAEESTEPTASTTDSQAEETETSQETDPEEISDTLEFAETTEEATSIDNTQDNTATTGSANTENSSTSNSSVEELSSAEQSFALTEANNEKTVSTGSVFSIGTGIALLLFNIINVRRFRQ